MKNTQPASAPARSAGARQGSSSGIDAAKASHSSARPRSGNEKRDSGIATMSAPNSAQPRPPSGASPSGVAASSTITG